MAGRPWRPEELDFLREHYLKGADAEWIAGEIKRTVHAVYKQAEILSLRWGSDPGFTVSPTPTVNRSIEELLLDQASQFESKKAHHESKQNIEIQLAEPGPFGVLFFGDPHLGDPGCDIQHLCWCLELVRRTPRLFAFNMGDLTNNWVGRLGYLYGKQRSTDDEEFEMADWLLSKVPWLACILGNHDKWSRDAEHLCKKHGVRHVSHGGKFILRSGDATFKVDARHNHRGSSQYNPSHGQIKKSHRGSDCDVIIGAHIHTSAYTMLRNGETGRVNHNIRVGSFKKYDDYADANSFEQDTIGPAVLTIFDPDGGDVGRVKPFWDLEGGAEYLKWRVAA